MAAFDTTRTSYGAPGFLGRAGAVFTAVHAGIASWNDGRSARKALGRLSDRQLEDIGLVRGDIELIAAGKHRH